MADKYLLKVTAGPSYDSGTHQTVQVNTGTPTHVSNKACDTNLSVHIQNYHGTSIHYRQFRFSPNRPPQVCPAIPPPRHPTFLPTHTNMTNTASLLPFFRTKVFQAPPSSSATILTTQSATAYHPVLAQPSILSKDGSIPDLTEMRIVTRRIYMGVR